MDINSELDENEEALQLKKKTLKTLFIVIFIVILFIAHHFRINFFKFNLEDYTLFMLLLYPFIIQLVIVFLFSWRYKTIKQIHKCTIFIGITMIFLYISQPDAMSSFIIPIIHLLLIFGMIIHLLFDKY